MPSNSELRRITDIIYSAWDEARGGKAFPTSKQMGNKELPLVWNNCFTIKVMDILTEPHYTYSYIGKNIVEAYGEDLTGIQLETLVSPDAKRLLKQYNKLVEKGEPLVDEGDFVNTRGQTIKYRQCLVPLGDDGMVITDILGGMRYKIF